MSYVLSTIERLTRKWRSLPRPPIVIIQGDDGPGLGYDGNRPLSGRTDGRMSIFFAIAPAGRPIRVPRTPVNICREVFNGAFGTHLPILADRSFVSSWTTPFDFHEVQVAGTAGTPEPSGSQECTPGC